MCIIALLCVNFGNKGLYLNKNCIMLYNKISFFAANRVGVGYSYTCKCIFKIQEVIDQRPILCLTVSKSDRVDEANFSNQVCPPNFS